MQKVRPFFKVTIISSQGVKKQLVEGGEFTVGRSNESDIILPFQGVSRKHFSIKAHDGEIIIEDHKSTYGTFIDGKRLPEKPVRYDPATSIQLGELNIYLIVRLFTAVEVAHLAESQNQDFNARIVKPEETGDANHWLPKKLNWGGKSYFEHTLSEHFKSLEQDFENNIEKLLSDAEKVKKEIEKQGRADARLVIKTAHKVAEGLEQDAKSKAEDKYKEIVKEVEGYVKSKKSVADELVSRAEKRKNKLLNDLQNYIELEKEKIQEELAKVESNRDRILRKAQAEASEILEYAEKESEANLKAARENIKILQISAEEEKEKIIRQGHKTAAEILAQAEKEASDIVAKKKAQSLLEIEKIISEYEAKGKEIVQESKVKAEIEAERLKVESEKYKQEQIRSSDEYFDNKIKQADALFKLKQQEADEYLNKKTRQGDVYYLDKEKAADKYFATKVKDGDDVFEQKVKDGDKYFNEKRDHGDLYHFKKLKEGDEYFEQKKSQGEAYYLLKTEDADTILSEKTKEANFVIESANSKAENLVDEAKAERNKILGSIENEKEQLEQAKAAVELDIKRLKEQVTEQEKIKKLDWKSHREAIDKLQEEAEIKGRKLVEKYNLEGQQNFKTWNKKLKQELKDKIKELRKLEHEFRRKIKKQSSYFYDQESRLKQEVLGFKDKEVKKFIEFLSNYKQKINVDLDAKVKELTQSIESLEKSKSIIEFKVEELQGIHDKLSVENNRFKEQKKQLEQELEELTTRLQKLYEEQEKSIQDYKKQKKQIARDVKALNEEIFEKQKEMRTGEMAWEKEKEKFIKKVKQLETQLSKYQSDLGLDKEYVKDLRQQFIEEKKALELEVEKNVILIQDLKKENQLTVKKLKIEFEEKLKAEKRKNNNENNLSSAGSVLKKLSAKNSGESEPRTDITGPLSADIEDNVTEKLSYKDEDKDQYSTTKSEPIELFEQTKREHFSGFEITEKVKGLKQLGVGGLKSVRNKLKTPSDSGLERAKQLLADANNKGLESMEGQENMPAYPELPDEIEEFQAHAASPRYRKAMLGGIIATLSLALFFVFKKDLIKANNKLNREIASANVSNLLNKNNNSRGTKFTPHQTPDFKESFVKNIIYTKQFYKNKNQKSFTRNWQVGLKKYFSDKLNLKDDTYVRFLGIESRFLEEIKNKSESLTMENKEQLIQELHRMESDFRKKSEKLLGSSKAYQEYYMLQKDYYEKYFK